MARNFLRVPSFEQLNQMSLSEVSKTYTGLRDIFRMRMIRLAPTGNAEARAFVQGTMSAGKTISEIKSRKYLQGADNEAIRQALLREAQDVINLLGAPSGGYGATSSSLSVLGIRAKRREQNQALSDALSERGWEHISPGMMKRFGDFMDAMRQEYGYKLRQSILVVEFFDSLKYNSKRMKTDSLIDLWKEFEANDYKPNHENAYLFRT